MKSRLRNAVRLVRDAGVKFSADNGSRLAAALAFYTVLSLSPLVIVVVMVAGLLFGEQAARGELLERLHDTVGKEAAAVIEQLVAGSVFGSGGVVAAAIGFAVLFFAASSVFVELRGSLNHIWHVADQPPPDSWFTLVWERLVGFALVCAVIGLLVASLLVSAVLSAVNQRVAAWVPGAATLLEVWNFVLTFVLLIVLFAMVFKWLPHTDLAWSDVWLGAMVTALLFSIGKYAIGLYLGTAAIGSAYGAAGVLVVLLVWVSYSAQIVLFGAELTFEYARQYGSGLNPKSRRVTAPGPNRDAADS